MNCDKIVRIEKIVSNGSGLGRHEGKAVFIPFTVPGETVAFREIESKNDYSLGEIERIIEPSQDRTDAPCPYFTICGGCDFQHIRYNAHQIIKENILRELFRKNARTEIEGNINYFTSSPYNYRNHIDFTGFSEGYGFRKRSSKHTIHISQCAIARDEINSILLSAEDAKNILKQFYILDFRVSTSGETLMSLYPGKRNISSNDYDKLMRIKTDNMLRVSRGKMTVIKGRHELTDLYGGTVLSYSRSNFMQTNHQITLRMLEYIQSVCIGGKLLDLYSGVGLFSLFLAHDFKEILSIEGSRHSVDYQRINAQKNNVNNIKIVLRDISDSLVIKDSHFDTVIADPPRCGISLKFLDNLLSNSINRFIYVSCNPATLARDSVLLLKKDFALKSIAIFDMFPQTRHFETVMIFDRLK